ncbi:hypothetical protein AVDCRST_MAG84-1444 [uncultured Microcoleus sp.]|uniref:Uncharacterized protein n=1 Tax=uncultured Microcoleus sp. TaxID=259945 RepID=A0A6J4L9D1_9CYAN|nr:hypothetical protein AVDCRST_MAG84-1444 [uncultured Microcoleus sp.]
MKNQWLILGGILSFAVALLHVVIIFIGAPAYRYFSAGEDMAKAAESGSAFPAVLTLVLVAVFATWGFYGLSGAGVIRRLPLLKIALILIGAVYTLRGVAVFQQFFQIVTSSAEVAPREIVFSLVSLVIGLAYLIGTVTSWRSLGASSRIIQT